MSILEQVNWHETKDRWTNPDAVLHGCERWHSGIRKKRVLVPRQRKGFFGNIINYEVERWVYSQIHYWKSNKGWDGYCFTSAYEIPTEYPEGKWLGVPSKILFKRSPEDEEYRYTLDEAIEKALEQEARKIEFWMNSSSKNGGEVL